MRFIHGDCGQPIGVVDGTPEDLRAEQAIYRASGFDRDLTEAIETGKALRRSSSMLDSGVTYAIWAVAREYPNPTPQTIAAARAEYQSYIDWIRTP